MGENKYTWSLRGKELYKNKDYEAAVEAYRRAIQLGDDSFSGYYNLALACCELKSLKFYEVALEAIKEAILRRPSDAGAYRLKARILAGRGEVLDALLACGHALDLDPKAEATGRLYALLLSPLSPGFLWH